MSARYLLPIAIVSALPLVALSSPPTATDAPQVGTDSVAEAIRSATRLLDELDTAEDGHHAQSLTKQIEDNLDVIRTADESNPWLAYLYGRMLAKTGRQGDAIRQLRRFTTTREGRNEWHAYLLLGDLFVGEFPRLARANYQKAQVLNEDEADVFLGLSKCALKLGHAKEAIALARQATEANPTQSAKYRIQLIHALRHSGQWDEAAREAETALEQSKRDAQQAPGKLAPLLIIDTEYQLLIDVFRSRIREASMNRKRELPFDATGFANDHLRLAHYMRERAVNAQSIAVHEMLKTLQSGVNETAPETPIFLLESYGVILAEAGRRAAAIDVFEQILSIDSTNKPANDWLNRLRSSTDTGAP